ncbi:hypothetical protein [Prochlorococcus marinus]|uniref:hypothetical protein n=1 Tax=Prochlorococcus TaxID=1218 RepID=UPI0007B3DB49|nr:hypothetical protein [Prochlorococcus marinus]KZR76652.1 hypothetical protein PMIT1323_01497 [Prochlorococcus marinus str. MIT 1323]
MSRTACMANSYSDNGYHPLWLMQKPPRGSTDPNMGAINLAMGREPSATPTEQQTVHQGLSSSTSSSKNP